MPWGCNWALCLLHSVVGRDGLTLDREMSYKEWSLEKQFHLIAQMLSALISILRIDLHASFPAGKRIGKSICN